MAIFVEHKWLSAGIFATMALGVLLKLMLGILYSSLIKETDNMAVTENKLLKQCKVKFSNCYELNNGVSNIPVFVDKFLSRLTLGPIPFEAMYHVSGQLILLSVVLSGIGVCISIATGSTIGEILPFYIVSFAGLYLYFSVSSAVDVKGRRRILKINLIDYLENHLAPRIQVTKQDVEMLYGNDAFRESGDGRRKRVEFMPVESREPDPTKLRTAAEGAVTEEELEALLREFLTG